MYYDINLNKKQTASQLRRRGLINLKIGLAEIGIFPLSESKPEGYNSNIHTLTETGFEQDENGYKIVWDMGYQSIESIRFYLTGQIKDEAQTRILKIWSVSSVDESLIRQTNQLRSDVAAGTTDERFTKTDAIRVASNGFEAALAGMDVDELAGVVVREWDGWGEPENETVES